MTFSISAPHYTKDDQQKELSSLSFEEKEQILDDMYGVRRRRHSHRNGFYSDGVIVGDNSSATKRKRSPAASANNDSAGDGGINGTNRNVDHDINDIQNDAINNLNNNINIDISEEMLQEFDDELQRIPIGDMIDYLTACRICPRVVQNESNEYRMLRSCNYNAKDATKKLISYWKVRVELFGQANAFKPMAILAPNNDNNNNNNRNRNNNFNSAQQQRPRHGAMYNDIDTILKYPTLFRLLPCDDSNRIVVCIDKTNIKFAKIPDPLFIPRMHWYVMQIVLAKQEERILRHRMQQQLQNRQRQQVASSSAGGGSLSSASSRSGNASSAPAPKLAEERGVVYLLIDRKCDFDSIPRAAAKMMGKVDKVVPIQLKCVHFCFSSVIIKIFLPALMPFMPRWIRQRCVVHNSIKNPTILSELEEYGLHRMNLPKSIGGTYDDTASVPGLSSNYQQQEQQGRNQEQPWLTECHQIMNNDLKLCRNNINDSSTGHSNRRRRFKRQRER